MSSDRSINYGYASTEAAHTHRYLWNPALRILQDKPGSRIFDLGCGNGAFARYLKEHGFTVHGVDPSEEAISRARESDPSLRLELGNAYDDLAERFGRYPTVTSLEVVEHVYYPRKYATCIANLLQPGGTAIISTPYHGYLKNLTLAASGKMDQHFTALWDHGHIKFWSVSTLTTLFQEAGLTRRQVLRVGRIPTLAKSMILVFEKPGEGRDR